MLDTVNALQTSASVHALSGSTRPGAVPPFAPVATAGRPGAPAAHPDAEVIELAGRVAALARRERELWACVATIDSAAERMVLSRADQAASSAPTSPGEALAEPDRAEAAAAVGLGIRHWEKLAQRASARLHRWGYRLARSAPTTQAGLKAKADASRSCVAGEKTGLSGWRQELATSISVDALRLIGDEADARAREDQARDGHLLHLGRLWRDCADRHDRAVEARLEVEEGVTLPEPPEALFIPTETDPPVIGSRSQVHYGTGRRWYGDLATIKRLQGVWPYDFCRARRDEILAAHDAWTAEREAVQVAAGLPEAHAACDLLAAENQALRRRILAIPASTREGLELKIAVTSWCLGDVGGMEVDLAGAQDDGEAGGEAFALAVVLDAHRMLSRSDAPALVPIPAAAPAVPDRRAVAAYRAWLHMEAQLLGAEMYPQGGDDARWVVPANTAASDFHFPPGSETAWRDLPQPSSRAEAMCRALGIDWTKDRLRDASYLAMRPAEAASAA